MLCILCLFFSFRFHPFYRPQRPLGWVLFLGPWHQMGVGGQPHAPAASTPGKDPVPIVGPVWTGVENLAPTGIRSPDLPTHSQSLHQLRYPTHSQSLYRLRYPAHRQLLYWLHYPAHSQSLSWLCYLARSQSLYRLCYLAHSQSLYRLRYPAHSQSLCWLRYLAHSQSLYRLCYPAHSQSLYWLRYPAHILCLLFDLFYLIVYLQFNLLMYSSCFSSFVFSTWFIFSSYRISNLPARTLRIFHLSPLLAHHLLDPSVSCIYHTCITHTFFMCGSFLDHLTLKMEAVWSSKMSGTTPSDTVSHWRRLESSARSLWEPQIYK